MKNYILLLILFCLVAISSSYITHYSISTDNTNIKTLDNIIDKFLNSGTNINNEKENYNLDNITCYELINSIMSQNTHWSDKVTYTKDSNWEPLASNGTGFRQVGDKPIFRRGLQGILTFDFNDQIISSEIDKEFNQPNHYIELRNKKAYAVYHFSSGKVIDQTEEWINGSMYLANELESMFMLYNDRFEQAGCPLNGMGENIMNHYKTTIARSTSSIDILDNNLIDGEWEIREEYDTIWDHPNMKVYELNNYMDIYKEEIDTDFFFVLWTERKWDFNFYDSYFESINEIPRGVHEYLKNIYWGNNYKYPLYIVDINREENRHLKAYNSSDVLRDHTNYKDQKLVGQYYLWLFSNTDKGYEVITYALEPYSIFNTVFQFLPENVKNKYNHNINDALGYYIQYDLVRQRYLGLR